MTDLRYRIGKTHISRTTPQKTINQIKEYVDNEQSGYICVCNMRSLAAAHKDSLYLDVLEKSLMNTPDGTPLVWMAHLWGYKDVKRTMGPEFFIEMLYDKDSGLNHFLLGDTEETLAAMREKFKESRIVGTFSPPFCEVDEFDYHSIAEMINKSGADLVWVSLRAPKQDIFASKLVPLLDKKVCIGVGAAFRFSLGKISQPSKFIQKSGLTGIFWRKWDTKLISFFASNVLNLCKWSTNILWCRMTK